MGVSLGLTATTMAVRSAFALLCFALLCGLAAASSGFQSETETELTKNEGEAAGNQILVAEAVESRVARGSKKSGKKNACKKDPKSKECLKTKRNKPGKRPKKDKPKKNRNKTRRNNNRQKKNPKNSGKPGKGGKKGSKKLRKNGARHAKKEKKKEAKKAKKIAKKLLKKARKNNGQFSRKNTKASNATVNLTCLTTAIQLLKFQKDNVNNFLSRHTRQIKQNALTTKKQGKKG